jgi:hypothetical protein
MNSKRQTGGPIMRFAKILMGFFVFASAYSQDNFNVYVPGNAGWVNTNFSVNSGEQLTITATGLVSGTTGMPPSDTPDGNGWAGAAGPSYIAPGLTRYSLVGKIGNNQPFQVGSSFSEVVNVSGTLYLAYNDEEYSDNSGGYTVTGYTGDNSLLVQLSLFQVENTSNGILLNWTTESELDNLGFIIERRLKNDLIWKQVASYQNQTDLVGMGTTSNKTNYNFLDRNVFEDNIYEYRLLDVNSNGQISYSYIKEIKYESLTSVENFGISIPNEFNVLPAYPNPFNPQTQITILLPEEGLLYVNIYDLIGREVAELTNGFSNAGEIHLTWNAGHFKSGTYWIKVRFGLKQKVQKVLLLK